MRDGTKAFAGQKNKGYFSVTINFHLFKKAQPLLHQNMYNNENKSENKIINNKGIWNKIYRVNAIQEYSTESRLTINIPRIVICIFQC